MAKEKKDTKLEKARNAKPDKKKKKNASESFGARSSRWFREMRSELRKVVWPTRKQLINNSIIVFVVVAIMGVFLFGFDQAAMVVVNLLISIGS